ncbi:MULTISPECIES: methionine synthase [Methanobacterium]|jgi:5-methyltetrahydropteroyltriglutamate--homocysteine methyltransferase|uniref:Methionine synthase n=1 Tax=Methanobacterium subterraneum TaxID=59277 RepID=A0A2H4V9D3_9EURY|nr:MULTISPECIES: methionine synthase [Methanobacterium]AUB54694.1 methionine synthase [Methanobacterium subterraneum]AUB58331.1 methionine synthase [Methanobacterium sp. MZ-A1]MBW4256992.1 methionine synthase [Methanobacterium sp. YSL]NMO08867.1 methionine synthase [Methanobacterium subterraneum]
MLTTVVGSYPSPPQEPQSLGSKISALMGNYDPYKSAVEYAVSKQIKAGVNIISTGQVRGDMVEIFARDITGMAWEEGTSKIKGKILPLTYSIGANDVKIALKIANNMSEEFKAGGAILFDGNFQEDVRGVKGIITGPTTLVLSSRMEGFYTLDKRDKAIMDLAQALKREAKYLENAGVAMIQFDEPFLSTGMANIKTAYRAIKIVQDGLKVPLSMHVCGDVSHVLGEFLKFPVDIIDCEFAGIGKNLEILQNTDLKGKKIGFGCVDTKTERVESPEEILTLIKKGIELIGVENMIVDPDCGMRMLPSDVAYQKLKNMTEAVRWLS